MDRDDNSRVAATLLYREEQRFRQPLLRGLLMLSNAFLIVLFGSGIYIQLVLGRPWGGRPLPDTALVLVAAVTFLVMGSVTYLLLSARLVTEVRSDGLYLRFIPFHRGFRRIGWAEISRFAARQYRPLREYGGWGIRWGRRGMAYNVSGSRGVQLELLDGRQILIGSQRAEELAAAMAAASGKTATLAC